MDKKEFGSRLYKLMVAKGMHHAELARAADLPRNNVSTYINGRSRPREAAFLKLAKALDISPDELMPNWRAVLKGGRRRFEEAPELAFESLGNGEAMIHVNQVMPVERAMRILAIAGEEESKP